MIEWKKFDADITPEFNKMFLVCNKFNAVYIAEIRSFFGNDELEWRDGDDCYLHWITHYAEINLPK